MRTPARPEPIEDLMLQPAQTPQTPSDKQGQVLRVLLVLPALLALLGWLAFPNTSCRQGEIGQILRGLYLSVVLPPACGAFLPYATLKAWMRSRYKWFFF